MSKMKMILAAGLAAATTYGSVIYVETFDSAPTVKNTVDNGNTNYGGTGEPDDMNQNEWYTRGTRSTITNINGTIKIDSLGATVWYLMDLTDLANPAEPGGLFKISFDVLDMEGDATFHAFAGGGLDYAGDTQGRIFFRMYGDPPLFLPQNGATGGKIVDLDISPAITNAGTFVTAYFDLTDLDNPGDYVAIAFGGGADSITIDNLQIISEVPSGTLVWVEVPDPDADEEGSDPGTIRIVRDDTTGDLDVNYTLGGTASTNDYNESYTSPATITDGNSFVDLVFTPVDDADKEGDGGETIILTLSDGASYSPTPPTSGEITIAENDLITIYTVSDGNWTNPAIWTAEIVPGADQTADINHDITIDSDVGSVFGLHVQNGNTDFITMSNGTLVVTRTGWYNFADGCVMGLYNGSSLTMAQSYRLAGDIAVIVDDSSFITYSLQDQGGSDTITIRNGSTFQVDDRYILGNGTTTFNVEGAGNSVYASLDEFGVNGTNNFVFKLDATDDALSTFTYDKFELTDDGTRNLIIDAADWNEVNDTFTLFSGVDTNTSVLAGTFSSVTVTNGSGSIAYDYTLGGSVILTLEGGLIETNGVTTGVVGGDLVIDTVSNATYIVESKNNLVSDPDWLFYTNFTGDGSTMTVPMATDDDEEFYRTLEAN
jgi:hypothetical protein